MAFDAALWSLGLSEEATALLNDNFDNLVNFVDPKHDRNRLKLWEPDTPGLSNDRREFLRGLRIPLWNKKPSLLLHELGSCAHDPTMQDRIGEVFRGGDMTCFVNSSGSGKTRHILEGLCLNWGFYLCLKEKTEDIGSVDMLGIQDRVELKKSHLTPNLPPKEDPTFVEKLIINQRLARACFSHVILARLLLFRMFLAAIMHSGRVISNADKWRWTLLQINPNLLGSPDGDIFDQLASILDSPTYEARRHPSSIGPVEFAVMSKVIMHKVTALLRVHSDLGINSGSQACRLYFVLDEAQIAAQALADAFRSQKLDPDTGDYVPRPLLREFLVVLEGLVLAKHGVIVTGTGLDIDLIEDAAKSVIYKGDVDDSIFTTDTGGFYDSKSKPAHLTYIKRYVPPDVLADESGQRLLERLPIWLTGRYRTTASLIVYLLQTDFKNPNDDFNNWVMYNTKFIPSDSPAQSAQISLPRDIEHRQDTLIKQLNYTKIVQDSDMRMLFENAVYQSFVRSSMTSMVVGKSRLMVECGFARFTDDYLSKVCIFEPLIILAALTRMEMGSNTRPAGSSRFSGSGQLLLHYTEQSIGTQKSAESNGYENYVALVLAKALGDFVPLQEIFSFHTIYRPAWIKRRARLVSVHLENASGPDSKPIKRSYEVNWPKYRLPSGHLGHTCNVKATLKWLKHEDPLRAAFCFPDSHMGPDIIFKLELDDGTFVWVVVQCKNHAKMQQNKSGFPKKTPEVIREAIKTVTPSEFWKNKKDEIFSPAESSSDGATLPEETAAALADFSVNSDMQAAPSLDKDAFRLIRVLAFFPPKMGERFLGLPKNDSKKRKKESKLKDTAGKHPICVLNWDYLKTRDKRGFMEDWEQRYENQRNVDCDSDSVDDSELESDPTPRRSSRVAVNRTLGPSGSTAPTPRVQTPGKRKAPSSSVKKTAKSSKRHKRGGEDEDMRPASESCSPSSSLTPLPEDRDRDVSMATASRAGTDIEMGDA